MISVAHSCLISQELHATLTRRLIVLFLRIHWIAIGLACSFLIATNRTTGMFHSRFKTGTDDLPFLQNSSCHAEQRSTEPCQVKHIPIQVCNLSSRFSFVVQEFIVSGFALPDARLIRQGDFSCCLNRAMWAAAPPLQSVGKVWFLTDFP